MFAVQRYMITSISAMRGRSSSLMSCAGILERMDMMCGILSNFTDVDDKLIRKSEETGLSVPEVADQFIAAYHEDADDLGIREATVHPRVTENMTGDHRSFIEGTYGARYGV